MAEQSARRSIGEGVPGSTEVLESCFGTLKALERGQSKGGFTGLVLGLGALVGKVTREGVAAALRSTEVKELIKGLREQSERLGEVPEGCAEDDARRVVAEALGYVRNDRERMDYPRYRMLGLPIFSAGVQSTIKQVNRRVKGSEKFRLRGGAEAMLRLRAARLSEDGTAARLWERPRPEGRAVGEGRLCSAA